VETRLSLAVQLQQPQVEMCLHWRFNEIPWENVVPKLVINVAICRFNFVGYIHDGFYFFRLVTVIAR
jgi:hypothetical protein